MVFKFQPNCCFLLSRIRVCYFNLQYDKNFDIIIFFFNFLFRYKKLEKARQDARLKDESLKKMEENLQNLENKAKGKDQIYKSQQDKIKELESQLVVKTNLHGQSEKQVSQLSDKLKGREEICCSLQLKVF